MTEEELMALLSSLSPEDLSALGLDGLFGPQLNQANFDLSSAMPIPAGTYDSKGRPEPYDLDTAAKAANVRQDYNSMLFDNVTGAMGGPGSYGLDAFTPKLKYGGDIVQQPGRQQADYYANSAGLGYQAAVAQEILSGVTPDVAAAHVMQLAMTPDEELTSEEARAQRDAIRQTLPPAPAGQGKDLLPSERDALTPEQQFALQYDTSALYDFAGELGSQIAGDPTGGFTDETTGLTYNEAPVEEWSAAAQKFMDLGLPFPTDQYTDRNYVEAMAPVDMDAWLNAMDSADAGYAKANQELRDNAMPLDEMRRAFEEYQGKKAVYDAGMMPVTSVPPGGIPAGPQPPRRGGAGMSRQAPAPPFGVQAPAPARRTDIFSAQPQTDPLLAALHGGGQKPASTYVAAAAPPAPAGDSIIPGVPNVAPVKSWSGANGAFPIAPKVRDVLGKPTLSTTGVFPLGPATAPQGNPLFKPQGGNGVIDADLLASYEAERQKRAKADSDAYGARTRASQAPADVLAQARQYGQSMSMRDRGQTPLNDALMQRILAIRAQGVVR